MERLRYHVDRLRPLFFGAWLVLILLVTWGSVSPSVTVPHQHGADKLIHFGAWTVLAFLPGVSVRPRYAGRIAILLTAAASLLLEAGQLWVPGRSPSSTDLLGNLAGIAFGTILAWWCIASNRRKQAPGQGAKSPAADNDPELPE